MKGEQSKRKIVQISWLKQQLSNESDTLKKSCYYIIGIICTLGLLILSGIALKESKSFGGLIFSIAAFLTLTAIWSTIGYCIINIDKKSICNTLNAFGLVMICLIPLVLIIIGIFISPYDPDYVFTKTFPKIYCGMISGIGCISIIFGKIAKDYRFVKGSITVIVLGLILALVMNLFFY